MKLFIFIFIEKSFSFGFFKVILRDKTMDNKLMYIPNDDKTK